MPNSSSHPYPYRKPPKWAYLRSSLPFLFTLLIFSFFLSSYSLLSHYRGPAGKQQIGWQSWDVVRVANKSTADQGVAVGDDEDVGEFVPSIPLDNWDPLSVHTTGLTEIMVKPCYFPPYLFPSYCAPETTPELDKQKGKWVVVEKDLNLRDGLWYLNIYYRRTRRFDIPLISSIRVVPEPPPDTLKDDLLGWTKADGNLHSGVWPNQDELRLWYKLKDQDWDWWKRQETIDGRAPVKGSKSDIGQGEGVAWRQEEISWEYGEMITELDVIYGDDEPFFGFERVEGGKVVEAKAGKWESVGLAYKRGSYVPPKASVPKFNSEGKLKIMQIADLHYSVGSGQCKETDKDSCVGDQDTADWLGEALDAEEPDLVVFSGDQLNGQGTSYDARSVLAKFARPVIDREVPWCVVFGNHDSEDADDREYQMRTIQNMPYSLSKPGPAEVDGVGNYFLKLHSSDPSREHIFTLYFLDSHARQKKSYPWSTPDYDYIKTTQIDWFLNVSASIKPISRPHHPDTGTDLGSIWSRSRFESRTPPPTRLSPKALTQKLSKPNAMMFFHIPLPEAYNPADTSGFDQEPLEEGVQLDHAGNSAHNSGFFYNAIKAPGGSETGAKEEGVGDLDWDWEREKVAEVKVLSHGHCHNTDRCRRVDGVWICFDGGSSYAGYGELGFDRRVRIYEISDYGETIGTYKRTTAGEILDRMNLVGKGAAEGVGEDQVN